MPRARSHPSPASTVASRSAVAARGAQFFDDYAHVPTELAVTLAVARARQPGRVVAVFQPHRYSRTQALWRELGAALTAADLVVVTDVYGANQAPIPGVTGALVVDGVRAAAPDQAVIYAPHREEAIAFLADEVRAGDLVITLGCGDIWTVADAALARIGGGGRVPDLAEAERILRARSGPALRVRFPIAPLTTFRIGGPAALFVEAEDDDALDGRRARPPPRRASRSR